MNALISDSVIGIAHVSVLVIAGHQIDFNLLSVLYLVAINFKLIRPVKAIKAAFWV